MAFAPLFDLSSLDGQTGLSLVGEADDAETGFVAAAGDINGDGYDDFLVGASHVNAPGGVEAGALYVVLGRPGGFQASLDLATLSGPSGFRINGLAAGNWLGASASALGDINGDGFDDFAVGAPYVSRSAGTWTGAAYVVLGRSQPFGSALDVSGLTGANGHRIEGAAAGDVLGYSVAGVGDVNGDGFDDFLVGAPMADPGERDSAGASYLIFGKAAGFSASLNLATLDGANGFRIEGGEDAPDLTGEAVSAAGDINGDGYADLLIGANTASPGSRFEAGSAYVLYGAAGGFSASIDLTTLNGTNGFRIDGLAAGDLLGDAIASAGDINGDGLDDLIVGAPYADVAGRIDAGVAYVVFGRLGGYGPNFNLANLNGDSGFRILGAAAGDGAGVSVSSAGDVNGDGFADLLVGAPFADPSARGEAGNAWLIYGRSTWASSTVDLAGAISGVVSFPGLSPDDEVGVSVAGAGDVNGDGVGDLLLGAPFADAAGRGEPGLAYLVFGFAAPGATAGADSFVGTAGSDGFDGLAGNDTFSGGGGNDRFEGGAGLDRAIFAGVAADYEVWRQGETWRVRDLRAGFPEGIDTLSGVEALQFADRTVDLTVAQSTADRVTAAYQNVLRATATGAEQTYLIGLIASVSGGVLTFDQAVSQLVQKADQTTAVAGLSYQFFLGYTPSGGGFDYLVSPQGPNPNNINSAYYQAFNIENRYINFAVNLGKLGEGAAAFQLEYGQLTLAQATKAAYAEIFGLTPTDQKVNDILKASVGANMTREQYFAVYGGDGLQGIGTKAAMVGWLLTEAAKADIGIYAKSSNAFLSDLADGARTQVDLVGVYGHPEWAFGG